MKISTLLEREPFDKIFEKTMTAFFSDFTNHPHNVKWYPKKCNNQNTAFMQQWYCNPLINSIFVNGVDPSLFDPISVTKTGRKINLQSDARYRFERGIDSTSIDWGVDKATEMILDLCGGEVSYITIDRVKEKEGKIIKYEFNTINTLGGIDINSRQQIKILKNLGFIIKSKTKTGIIIKVPNFRPDIDGSADIVEEILRIYGFDKIEPISLLNDKNQYDEILNSNLKSFYKSKRLIANRGYLETVTWSFMDKDEAKFINSNFSVNIRNPISSDLSTMRPSTFPNLLAVINHNLSRFYTSGKMFEVGPNFHGTNEEDQKMVATAIQYGLSNTSSWINEKRRT